MRRRCCCGGGETPFTCACMDAVRPNPLYFTGRSTVTGNWLSFTLAWNAALLRWRYFDGFSTWEIRCISGALQFFYPTSSGPSSQAFTPGSPGTVYTCDPFSLTVDNAAGPKFAPMMVTE